VKRQTGTGACLHHPIGNYKELHAAAALFFRICWMIRWVQPETVQEMLTVKKLQITALGIERRRSRELPELITENVSKTHIRTVFIL
jgi:hypothetical protein